MRGGSYAISDRLFMRSAFRTGPRPPTTRNVTIGFRLLRMETDATAVAPQGWGQIKDGAR